LPLIMTATATVYFGSTLSNAKSQHNSDLNESDISSTLNNGADIELSYIEAICIPVSASIFLLLLFFFFPYMQYFLLITVILGSTTSLFEIARKMIANILIKMGFSSDTSVPFMRATSLSAFLVTLAITMEWLRTGNFIAHNILGCSLCLSFISTLRFPSLKLAVICLTGLVIYDIYWVFFSEFFFKSNVMVEVATKAATNPVYDLGAALQLPLLQQVTQHVELPIKLLFPSWVASAKGGHYRMMMLGLGDIALPGALVSLAQRCDDSLTRRRREEQRLHSLSSEKASLLLPTLLSLGRGDLEQGPSSSKSSRYGPTKPLPQLLLLCTLSYFVSLAGAILASQLSGHAQPALIYLVPGVLGVFAARSWACGVLGEVWLGPAKIDQTS